MRDWPPVPKPGHGRAVFLDRDGTINEDTHFPHRIEDLVFVPMALEGLRLLAELPLDVIVASNQAGIALGLFTREEMSAFNEALRQEVKRSSGRIDAFYCCPELDLEHAPPGAKLASCAKPHPGMLLEAAEDFALDLEASFLVGDRRSDVEAAERAGCASLLVKTGRAGRPEGDLPLRPRFIVADLLEAASLIRSRLDFESGRSGPSRT